MAIQNLRAALFDLDGTLIDSEHLWQEVEIEVFGALGVPLTVELARETTGMSVSATTRAWRERYPWESPSCAAVEAMLIEAVAKQIRARGVALPGSRSAVLAARAAGLSVALATNSPPAIMDAALARLSLDEAFDVKRCLDGRRAPKPAPDIFLSAADGLGVDPAACVVFEDSLPGMAAAKAAGMSVVMVSTAAQHDRPELARADLVLESLESVTCAWFAQRSGEVTGAADTRER